MPQSLTPFTVAIVEDERILREELAFQLMQLNFTVRAFDTVEAFYRYLAVDRRIILILDIGLHGEDGLSACQYLREHDVPIGIVMVTARSLQPERVEGLAAGADAYLVKPVDVQELAIIIKNLAARLFGLRREDLPGQIPCPWQIHHQLGGLQGPKGPTIRLSRDEERILSLLFEQPNTVCPFVTLATAIGMLPEDFDKHRLEVIISRLRQRVLRDTGEPLPIRTIRGLGYQFDCKSDETA
jgi:DNA-binding response OmpR family regulator